MFSNKEKRLMDKPYFIVVRETEQFIEVISKSTNHCWIVFKNVYSKKPITLYHKHSVEAPYYHRHYETYSVTAAVNSIKSHDKYVLKT